MIANDSHKQSSTMIRSARPGSSGGVSSGSSSHGSAATGRTQCVPECIVHRNKPAVIPNDAHESSAISAQLAAIVAKKAFALDVQLVDELFNLEMRCGQAGLIQCPTLPTEDSSLPDQKKRRLLAMYGPPKSILKPSTGARVCAVPVTAVHNVLDDVIGGVQFSTNSTIPAMISPAGIDPKLMDFSQRREGGERIPQKLELLKETKEVKHATWKYGIDIDNGNTVIRKKNDVWTDANLSFEAVSPDFQYKIRQKVGMVVYRDYQFDFSNDEIYKNNGWDKTKIKPEEILELFGPDNSVAILTGEITRVSRDQKTAIEHDINTYKGCSGAIIFLLDKDQDGLVDEKDYGKAIAIHAGGLEEASGEQREQRNVAFIIPPSLYRNFL